MSLKLGLLGSKVCSRAVIALLLSGALVGCSEGEGGKVVGGNGSRPIKIGDPVDVNGDGKPDGVAVDSNGDGVPDSVDLDGDGKGDVGLPPGLPIDTNGDGKTDGVTIDTDGDGVADGVDLDGDGVVDIDLGWGGGGDAGCTSLCPGTDPPPGCGDTPFELKATKTNVMFLVDGSNSMAMYWNTARQAIADIVNANPNLNFGVHVFSAEGGGFGEALQSLNLCGKMLDTRIDPAKGTGQKIVNTMGQQPPGAGNALFDRSPVLSGLNWYLENDSPLNDPETSNFLVVFSDLVDTCFGTLFSNPGAAGNGNAGSEQLLAFEKLAIELRKRHIRVMPIGFDGNPSNNSGGGVGGDVNEAALAAITKYGGTTLKKPLIAASEDDVKKAIKQIGVAVQPCRFTVPAAAAGKVNSFKLSFIVNGKIVPRDRTKDKGWDFVEGNTKEVEFYGDDCRALQDGKATVEARDACSGEEVCGVGATKITNRAQAMHILLDGSASMQGGLGGWANAIFTGRLTPWGEATSSLAQMVVDPINDNVEFGFQFFPPSAQDSCDAAITDAEVPIGQGTEISIIDQLLSNAPAGFRTPLVKTMDHIAANPGRLTEPDVLGTLLVVSDGGDSCAAADTRNTSLATAAASLQSAGVDTYAIKFDSGSSDAAQEDQLTNIAVNGGTDAYISAPDGKALTAELLKLSASLANCELRIGEPPPGADPTKLNVYLNGIVVPYDSMGTMMSGWGWVSDAANGDFSKLTLYGPQCKLLQQSRLNDIVIEFGCQVIVVQ